MYTLSRIDHPLLVVNLTSLFNPSSSVMVTVGLVVPAVWPAAMSAELSPALVSVSSMVELDEVFLK
jgi:hypothetical protein